MNINYARHFKKQFTKLDSSIKQQFVARIDILRENQHHPLLKIHKLHGPLKGLCSLNINADYRVIFYRVDRDTIILTQIGTHSELYS